MSKVIVDQIQKNGGDVLTLPSADATVATQPVVSDAAGTLSFHGVSMPSTQATANKVVTSDGSNGLIYSPYTIPSSNGTNGQVLTTDGAGAVTFQDLPAGGVSYYWHSFISNPATSVDIAWTDVISGVNFSDIRAVLLSFSSMASSNGDYFKMYGLTAAGTVTSGNTWGVSCSFHYNGTNKSTAQDTNNGFFRFPQYTTQAHSTYSYGSGLTGHGTLVPGKNGSTDTYHGMNGIFLYTYQQATGYAYQNREELNFHPYNTQQSDNWSYGLRLQSWNGYSINAGALGVALLTN